MSQYSQFSNNVSGLSPATLLEEKTLMKVFIKTLLERDSNAGVFLWVLQNFSEHLSFTEHLRWMFLFLLFPIFRITLAIQKSIHLNAFTSE